MKKSIKKALTVILAMTMVLYFAAGCSPKAITDNSAPKQQDTEFNIRRRHGSV